MNRQILKSLLQDIEVLRSEGSLNRKIRAIQFDSRQVENGDLFVAVKGTQTDGHRFIQAAVDRGAQTIVCQAWPEQIAPETTCLRVIDSAVALGKMLSSWYDHPSRNLRLFGVTGTNGKTTVASLGYRLMMQLGQKAGLFSTIENRIGTRKKETTHTTPDIKFVQSTLAEMVRADCKCVFMEVSSHAMHQNRIAGLQFAGGIFTNLTHDHLDYHGTFDAYRDSKKKFFDNLNSEAIALTNTDDKNGRFMVQNTSAAVSTFGLRGRPDFRGKILANSLDGLHMKVDDAEVHFRLIGGFNAYNILAAYAIGVLSGHEPSEVLTSLSAIGGAAGRFQQIGTPGKSALGIVDYAHTPDALDNVLSTLVELKKSGKLIVVVGCGGDRDREKRPIMARIATKYGDQVILTSDNPRSEDPERIIEEMKSGLSGDEEKEQIIKITDREEAIKTACRLGRIGDIIAVTGKGHEKYQEIKGERRPFDDVKILRSQLSQDI